jgi:hypothetical protein
LRHFTHPSAQGRNSTARQIFQNENSLLLVRWFAILTPWKNNRNHSAKEPASLEEEHYLARVSKGEPKRCKSSTGYRAFRI